MSTHADRYTLLTTSYLEPEHVERIRQVDDRLRVIYEPDVLGKPRYAADHTAPHLRTPADEARWRELLAQADILFDFEVIGICFRGPRDDRAAGRPAPPTGPGALPQARPSSPGQAAPPEWGGVSGAPEMAVKREGMEEIRSGRASSRPQANEAPARGAHPRRGHGELIKQVNAGNNVRPHVPPYSPARGRGQQAAAGRSCNRPSLRFHVRPGHESPPSAIRSAGSIPVMRDVVDSVD